MIGKTRFVRARLKTGGKTIAQIHVAFDRGILTPLDIKYIKKCITCWMD